MKYLILFLISFLLTSMSLYANYIPIEKVGLDEPLTVFVKHNKCQKHYKKDCVKIPVDYSYTYHVLQDELIDDLENPIHSKNQINKCGEYCQSLFDSGNQIEQCIDTEETLILNLDLEQIYCSRLLGYKQILSGKKIVIIDKAKKTLFDKGKKEKEDKIKHDNDLKKLSKSYFKSIDCNSLESEFEKNVCILLSN